MFIGAGAGAGFGLGIGIKLPPGPGVGIGTIGLGVIDSTGVRGGRGSLGAGSGFYHSLKIYSIPTKPRDYHYSKILHHLNCTHSLLHLY